MDIRQRKKVKILLLTFLVWAVMVAIWGFVWYQCYIDAMDRPFYRKGNWAVIAVYGALLYIVTQFYGGYRVGFYRRGDIIFSGIISTVVVNAMTYMQTSLIGRDWMDPRPILLMTVADLVLFWVWATFANYLYLRWNPPRELLVIYGGSAMAQSLIAKMMERNDKYIIREAVNVEEGMDAILDRASHFNSILICDVGSHYRNRLLKYCYEHDIRVYMAPKISDIIIRGSTEINLFDSPLLLSRNNGLRFEQEFLKRAMDIAVSLTGLLLASPFMLLVTIAIRLEDGKPVLFHQQRLTQGGRIFRLYKFRSMVVDAEGDGRARLASQNDDRITKVGKFIRATRLDELPQLVNILKGDMSLVGPRPERPEIAMLYKETMPEFDYRLKVKAGLTGYAQVHGKYNTTPYDKLKLDLLYITSYSILLDVKLILQTVKIVFMKSSTEGVQDK